MINVNVIESNNPRELIGKLTDTTTILSCGDSNIIMDDLPDNSVDLIITDPPYKNYQSNRAKTKTNKIDSREFSPITLINHIERLLKPSCHFYIFCDHLTFSSFYDAINNSNELHYLKIIMVLEN
jgi:DNA modification methylase